MTARDTLQNLCCHPGAASLPGSTFDEASLELWRDGQRSLICTPLGNRPTAPLVALVGITPGGQSNHFISRMRAVGPEAAAREAAFRKAHSEIIKLLKANGFAEAIGLNLYGVTDVNKSPQILTTSVVKCCLKKDRGYKYAAPDIVASPVAHRCATQRLVDEINAYPTLKYVIVFGGAAWTAIRTLTHRGQSVAQHLGQGRRLLQFPHFANNWKQKKVFCLSKDARLTHFGSWVADVIGWRDAALAGAEQHASADASTSAASPLRQSRG